MHSIPSRCGWMVNISLDGDALQQQLFKYLAG